MFRLRDEEDELDDLLEDDLFEEEDLETDEDELRLDLDEEDELLLDLEKDDELRFDEDPDVIDELSRAGLLFCFSEEFLFLSDLFDSFEDLSLVDGTAVIGKLRLF
ncbi:MAG: hypothetical protein ISS81_06430 [Candidatus Marinimicrobia bacterium]|nr:hypothetical protein [Candidatus Neomarinimicrobiota bacterium]